MAEPLDISIHTRGLPISGDDPLDLSLGGSETAVVSMSRALARAGHRVRVFCQTQAPRRVAEVDYHPASEVYSRLKPEPADVFLSCRHHHALSEPVPARLVGWWNHDMPADLDVQGALRLLSTTSLFFFLSEFHRKVFVERMPGVAPFGEITSNGVDFEGVESVLADRQPDSEGLRFAYASRPERGLDVLLEHIWPRLRNRFPDAELLVSSYDMASVSLPDDLQRFYAKLDALSQRTPGVRSLGARTRRDFWNALAGCRAVLYPTSFPEVSCMVALEAQALGVPVVATDAFALRETVGTAETRIAQPWGSDAYVERFLDVTHRLVERESFYQQVRDAGRRHVCPETHSWDAVARSWTELFADRVAHVSSSPPKVSATILVRDAEADLARCVGSFEDVADEILLGDTGSTDRTREVARMLGFVPLGEMDDVAPRPRRLLVDVEFEDFAQARNALAEHATGEWIYWQDADEVLVGAEELRDWVDRNVYFDGFGLEQRHLTTEGRIRPDMPVRCFRRETPDGPLGWVGSIHELVEHDGNRPPDRVAALRDAYVVHFGYLTEVNRRSKAIERNFGLLIEDRRRNPDRYMGYILGMREYLNLARWEIEEAGCVTRKAERCLQWGFEIWERYVSGLPRRFRSVGYPYSRQILEVLGRHGLPLRSTGRVPFETHLAFAAGRGGLKTPPADVPVKREWYASVEELRAEELDDKLERLETDLGTLRGAGLPPDTPDRTARYAELELPPELYGLAPKGDDEP